VIGCNLEPAPPAKTIPFTESEDILEVCLLVLFRV
jgi:hypothetical protein